MNDQVLENDIRVFCVTAATFPAGVMAAHQQLHQLVAGSGQRQFYGISWMGPGGNIIYKAAVAEACPGEAEEKQCEAFIIRKGLYTAERLHNWCANPGQIGQTFQQMLKDPRLDEEGYCLEIYYGDTEVDCLVKLNDATTVAK